MPAANPSQLTKTEREMASPVDVLVLDELTRGSLFNSHCINLLTSSTNKIRMTTNLARKKPMMVANRYVRIFLPKNN